MSSVLRPTFSEGQVLGAGDLNAQVSYDRFTSVLHERTEHLWGVAQGLALDTVQKRTDGGDTYVDVTLRIGRAVDRLGRSIVVSEPRLLDPTEFQLSSPVPGTLFPVFVQAIEVPHMGETQPGKCATALPTRIEEALQISFGTPGSELAVLDQDAAPVDVGFGTSTINDKVLVGWVKWSDALAKFTGVATSSNGRGIRYVGVVASEVVAPGGTLGLRTRASGSRFALTLTENSTGGCELRFGKQEGQGPPTQTFAVDDRGNVTYTGSLTPAPTAKTLAESGVAFDGVRLPLPSGVSEDQVASGAVRLHAVLSPVAQQPQTQTIAGTATMCFPLVIRCSADVAGDRRVHCVVRWCDLTNFATFTELPSACSYLIIASTK